MPFTAQDARNLYDVGVQNNFLDNVIEKIKLAAKNHRGITVEHSNLSNLEIIRCDLQDRGFTCSKVYENVVSGYVSGYSLIIDWDK